MRRHPSRIAAAAAIIVAAWGLVLWVAAAGHAPAGSGPAVEPLEAGAGVWSAIVGQGGIVAGPMAVTRFSDDGEALLVWRPPPFRASERPVLELALDGFPFNYVLMLAWRRAGVPDAAFTRLQVPTGRIQTYLLSRLADWQGTIEEIALYLHPRAGPALTIDEPITIGVVRLAGDGLPARLAALLTGWWGADPWNLRSVNTLGEYPDLVEGVPLTPIVFLSIVIGAAVCLLVFRPDPRGRLVLAVAWLLAGVLVINAHWLHGLVEQHRASLRLEARGDDLAPAFDRRLAVLIRAARRHLPAPPGARVLVAADAPVVELRAAWHLLPHNVAVALPALKRADGAGLAAGDYLLVYRRPDLLAQARTGRLRLGRARWRVELVYADSDGALLRFAGAES